MDTITEQHSLIFVRCDWRSEDTGAAFLERFGMIISRAGKGLVASPEGEGDSISIEIRGNGRATIGLIHGKEKANLTIRSVVPSADYCLDLHAELLGGVKFVFHVRKADGLSRLPAAFGDLGLSYSRREE